MPDLQTAGPLGEDLFVQSGSTGMVLVVVRDNQIFFRGYGETAPGSHMPPTQDALLRLCSLTKIFTADVLTKLVADGTVKLSDPLQRYAPRRGAIPESVVVKIGSSKAAASKLVVPKRVQSITLLDLATHTSGLARELGTAPHGTPHFTFPDYGTRWRWLPNQRLRSVPGTAALYSNVAFDLLSDALQTATHQQYAALLAERTLNPLHMRNTTFFPNVKQCDQLLMGAHDEGLCTSTEETAGSSGLYSTASDMAIWLQYLLGTGSAAGGGSSAAIPAQDPAAQAVYIEPSKLASQKGLDHAGEPTGIGLGWIHMLQLDEPSHIVEKTGGGAGFLAYIAINHARRTAVFVAATDGAIETHLNLFNATNKLLLAVAGLPPLPPPPLKPVVKRTRRQRRH